MAKKELKMRGAGSLLNRDNGITSDYPMINIENINDPRYEMISASLDQYTPDNAPTDYLQLKREVKELSEAHAKTFVILAHRLKIIRDSELYKIDGYEDFRAFVEGELDVARSTVYNYISIVELFGVQHVGHVKTSNLFIALPVIRNHPEKKEEIFNASQQYGRKEFLSFLKIYKEPSTIPIEEDSIEEDWFTDEKSLLSQSKFLREGMKPKTLDRMLKEIINLRMLQDPRNKELQKIKQILSKL